MSSKAMEREKSEGSDLVVYAIPGQNGLGSESEYIKTVLGEQFEIVNVGTPTTLPDLGQFFCERHLAQAVQKKNQEGVVYATSQGTATALNYFSKQGNSQKAKALVLEAALASGNSAVYHTVTGPLMGMDNLKNIPGAYYFVPYFANVACPGYRPGGQQAIKSIDKLSTDMPVIIIHSEDDMQLPFDGACALYYRLRQNGNNNVYLISDKGTAHIQILDEEKKDVVKRIIKKHLTEQSHDDDSLDFASYQPDHRQYKKQYDELIAKENKHVYLERLLSVTGLAFIAKYFLGY